jgi:hypothetical protein
MKKSLILWAITVVITVSTMIYQRATGPTYPKKVSVELAGKEYKFKLLRSNEIGSPCDIKLPIEDKDITAKIFYKKYKTSDELTIVDMERVLPEGEDIEVLTATLPEQPSAGKVQYYIELSKGNEVVAIQKEEPVIVRFKGFVPRYILIPHVLFMIISLFAGTRAGVEAIAGGNNTRKFAITTLIVLGIGGLILGPLVQLYAFGELWTGWPFGGDWTDNKTLFAWIFWLIAVIVLKKKPHNRLWPIIAVFVLFAMYMIPHSMGGSELNNETGKIETGMK